ncbi:MAG TPA: MerR family transcriptional regulator, partial [Actinopolymorphaceae bacterium]
PYQGEADPSGEIVLRVEPAHTEAYVTITRDQCAFPRIMAAYDAVDAWVSAADDLRLVGDAREVYFAAYDEISGADAFAHVAQPVVAAERSRA